MRSLRLALRRLRRQPGFTAIAIVTLALGIGVNLTMLETAYGFVLRPLPFVDVGTEDRGLLMALAMEHATQDIEAYDFSQPDVIDFAAHCASCAGVAAYDGHSALLEQPDRRDRAGALRVRGQAVGPSLFTLLNVRAAQGRAFAPDEADPGAPPVAVLSHALWQRLGADPSLVGDDLVLDGRPTTVIGVMPEGFHFPERADFWIPLTARPDRPRADRWIDNVVVRLHPGVSVDAARTEATTISARLADAYPITNGAWSFQIMPYRERLVNADVRFLLMLLVGAVGFVLLIACANVANLLLARAAGRQQTIAIHRALGASRGRLVRQQLLETLLLALGGAVLGFAFSSWSTDVLARADPEGFPAWLRMEPGLATAAFTLALTVLASLAAGLLPALHTTRDRAANLTAVRGAGRVGGQRVQGALVVAQIALAVVLLGGAGLAVKSAWALTRIDAGFDTDRLLTMRAFLPATTAPETRDASYRRLVERLGRLPGAQAATATSALPLVEDGTAIPLTVPELTLRRDERVVGSFIISDGGLFDVLDVPLLDGRRFDDAELRDPDSRAIIVSDTLARRLWGDGRAVGKRIRLGYEDDAPWSTVIGVVPKLYYEEPGEETEQSRLQVHLPHGRAPQRSMVIALRTTVPPATLIPQVREAAAEVDPSIAIGTIRTMATARRQAVWAERLLGQLFGSFAALALLIATLGIYGMMAFVIARRVPEIGIRMALGAGRHAIRALFLRRGMILIASGLLLGSLGAAAGARLMSGIFWGIEPVEPGVLLTALLALGAAAFLGVVVPCGRAMRVEPVEALRQE